MPKCSRTRSGFSRRVSRVCCRLASAVSRASGWCRHAERSPPEAAVQDLLANWQLQLQVLGTTAYAMLLGGAIGVEREMKNRPAGFRTHMLVAGAAALLVG